MLTTNGHTTHLSERDRLIAGLHGLAYFLERHPDLPVNGWVNVSYCVDRSTDDQERAEVDRIADILGVLAHTDADGDHYLAETTFGPVTYKAVAITAESMARYYAERTYSGAVTP